MKKKTFMLGLAAVASVALLASCGTEKAPAKETKKEDSKKELSLSFGVMPAVDSLPVYIAEKEGFF